MSRKETRPQFGSYSHRMLSSATIDLGRGYSLETSVTFMPFSDDDDGDSGLLSWDPFHVLEGNSLLQGDFTKLAVGAGICIAAGAVVAYVGSRLRTLKA